MSTNNVHFFMGAALLGAIGAVGTIVYQHFTYEKRRHAMAQDLARLDKELSVVKRELHELLTSKHDSSKSVKKVKTKRTNSSSRSTVDYLSASAMESSDLEFYDISDSEVDNASQVDIELSIIDRKLDECTEAELEHCLEKLKDLNVEYPDNADLLWRIGKVHYKMSEISDDKEISSENILKGIEACDLAISLNPNNSEAHKWYAILIGSRSQMQTMQEKISDGYLFKKHVDIALSLSPSDPNLHHMKGRFCYEIAGLKWYERKVAAALFQEPPNSTYSEALEHFYEAEKLAKYEWKENKLFIAKCQFAMENFSEGIQWLEKAQLCKQGDGLDDKVDSEVKVLLQKFNSYR